MIITENICPPIPIRMYDWVACREDWDLGDITGYGETEEKAIKNLIEQENE